MEGVLGSLTLEDPCNYILGAEQLKLNFLKAQIRRVHDVDLKKSLGGSSTIA